MDSPVSSPAFLTAMMLVPPFPSPPTISPTNAARNIERPYGCPEPGCFQRFKRKFTLKEHIKTHTGEKPFTCPVKSCAKTFTTSGNLARHKRLHPWLKPQMCLVDGCDRSFSNEMKLERHMKTHFKGPRVMQTCPIAHCGKQFSTTGNLTRHLKQQHLELSLSDSEDSFLLLHRHKKHRKVSSPCAVDASVEAAPFVAFERIHFDASRAFNPLIDEVSDVNDDELLETLQCLF